MPATRNHNTNKVTNSSHRGRDAHVPTNCQFAGETYALRQQNGHNKETGHAPSLHMGLVGGHGLTILSVRARG